MLFLENASSDKSVVFVGEKQSGKSSLIAKLLDEPVKDDMKETTALDYRYGVRIKEEKKQKFNIYELGKKGTNLLLVAEVNGTCIGGGRVLSSLLSAPLNQFSLLNTVICIVVDLSSPGNAIDSLLYWLASIREHIQRAMDDLNKTNPQAIDILKQRAQEKWAQHDDRNKINYLWVPVVIVGSKFDVFANQYESLRKRSLCLAMRYIAHSNGCDLVFASVKEKLPTQLFKAMVGRQLFDSSIQARVDKDHNSALNIYAGSDDFLKIGEPEVFLINTQLLIGRRNERKS